MSTSPKPSDLPLTVGLCPDPSCRAEFHMPGAAPGDRCPMDHGGESPELAIYALRSTGASHEPSEAVIEAVGRIREQFAPLFERFDFEVVPLSGGES
jgi:hypothetical protein